MGRVNEMAEETGALDEYWEKRDAELPAEFADDTENLEWWKPDHDEISRTIGTGTENTLPARANTLARRLNNAR